MRLAVISHACVVDVNQRLYAELANLPEVELLLIAPRAWRASTGRLVRFRPLPGATYISRPLPVWGSGQISLHVYRGLARALRAFAPDVIYLDEEPYSLPAWQMLHVHRRLGVPIAFCQTQNIVKRHPWPFSTVEQRMLDTARVATPITEECGDVLREKGFRGRIMLVPHCVDTDLFRPRPQVNLRRDLGLRDRVVGYVGRLTEAKGVHDLMRAAELLWQQDDLDFTLMLVGDGPLREELQAQRDAHPEGRVVLVGTVAHNEVPGYFNALDMLVLPSHTTPGWKEQFGRVIIEALACEVPLVGSSSGNIPMLIEETGGGVVFPERDAEALASAIRDLLLDPAAREAMGKRGREAVLRKYSYPRVAEKLHAALSAALD